MRTMFWLFSSVIILFASSSSLIAKPTTVALTTTVPTNATTEEKQLAANLLALLEVEASQRDSLQVVERQQLDLALHEQVISNVNSERNSLQIGKLSAAELILTAKLQQTKVDDKKQLMIRVTESKTAVVRGVTVVPVSTAEIEEAAAEIIEFLAFHIKAKRQQTPTIAVLPFESVERFDRLRPLERGLRDLFVSVLMQEKKCRVVQRSSMEQLLEELELVRAGLTNKGKGFGGEPTREAAFVLRGEINEKIAGPTSSVLVKVQLVNARSHKVVTSIEKSGKREAMPRVVVEVATEVLMAAAPEEDPGIISPVKMAKETNKLFEMALRDVHRIHRLGPIGMGYRPWGIPGVRWPSGRHPSVKADSELGQHLLKKSIDRLESILFIEPDRLTVALPLAYCRSFHLEEIWNPEQCEKLLRRILNESSDPEFIEEASLLLADMYFPHQGNFPYHLQKGTYDPKLLEKAFEHRLEMFVAMYTEGVSGRARLYRMLEIICSRKNEEWRWQKLLDTVLHVDRVCQKKELLNQENGVPGQLASLAYTLVKRRGISPILKEEALAQLTRLQTSNNPTRAMHSLKHLYFLQKVSAKKYSQAIDKVYAVAPEKEHPENRRLREQAYRHTKLDLAKRLLQSGEAARSLSILQNTRPGVDQRQGYGYDFGYGEYGYTLAKCYESLGRKQEALDTYVRYAELPYGYSHGYSTDFMGRIKALGGVPVSKDRDVNVRYPKTKDKEVFYCRVLATDGEQLFCGGGYQQGRVGKGAVPIRSVHTLDLKTNVWTHLDGPDDRVSCLVLEKGFLWAGTDSKGLWRLDLSTGKWRWWTVDDGLPTNSIIQMAVDGQVAYVSVGNLNQSGFVISGGIVRVDAAMSDDAQSIHIYRGENVPETAPTSMAIHNRELAVPGLHHRLRSLDLKTDTWTLLERKSSPVVDAGHSGIWVAPDNYIATLLHQYQKPESSYLANTRLKNYPAGRYQPRFLLEHERQLWIGGPAWRRFGDIGLFRLDLKSGTLKRYGPRDGFRYSTDHLFNSYECYDAVWGNSSLWVSTSFGLTEVSMRDQSKIYEETPVEKFASQIRAFLPEGWSSTANSSSIRLRRKESVLVAPLYGSPPRDEEEAEKEYLHRIGMTIPLEINLSFVPLLSREKYEMFAHRLKYMDGIAKNGFRDKVSFSRYLDERAKARLPIYYTKQYSVYVNGIPPQYSMHNKAAHQEMKQIFAKLSTVLKLYEGANPLPY